MSKKINFTSQFVVGLLLVVSLVSSAAAQVPDAQKVKGEFARITTKPSACEKLHGRSLSDFRGRDVRQGPACQMLLQCGEALLAQSRELVNFLERNPSVRSYERELYPYHESDIEKSERFKRYLETYGGRGFEEQARLQSSWASWMCDAEKATIDLNFIQIERGPRVPDFEAISTVGRILLDKLRADYRSYIAEYSDLIAFIDKYPGVVALERAYAASSRAFENDDFAEMIRERPAMRQALEQARARKQLLTQQSAQISGYEQTLADLATALDRESLTEFADQQMRLDLGGLRQELQQLSQTPTAKRGDISAKLEVMDTRVRNSETAVNQVRARKELLTKQSAQISRYENMLSDLTRTLDRDALRKFFDQQNEGLLGDLKKQLQQLGQTEPSKRGDISSRLETIANRIADVERGISAARSKKEAVERIRNSLHEDEVAAGRIPESAAREELKPAFDEQFINSANELIGKIRELASLDLWVIRDKQEEIQAAKRNLAALQKQVSEAQAKYNRAKALDELRRTVIQKASATMSEFAHPEIRSKLTSDGLSVIATLKAQLDSLSSFDAIPMVSRPNYSETLAATEDALNKSEQFKAELAQLTQLTKDLRNLVNRIDERGRKLLDNSTSSQLAQLNNLVRTLSRAKIPLSADGHRQLSEARDLLGQLDRSVDAVMDREEKRILIRELPRRSGGWAFRFDIDKITDEEHARAVGSIEGSQAKYELIVDCRTQGSELLISTFESGGTASKRIPWDIDIGPGAHEMIRLRIDSNRAFTAQLSMRGYANQGQVEVGPEFSNLMRSSRLVLADIFPDEQVEISTAYPTEFKRLCELLSRQATQGSR